jgi:hypothetical protein
MAMMLALALALRLLSPAGFMPSFDHGAVTIVSCPDAWSVAPSAVHHHHHDGHTTPQPCPYAGAAAAGPLTSAEAVVAAPALAALTHQPSLKVEQLARAWTRDLPPATGPPLLPA